MKDREYQDAVEELKAEVTRLKQELGESERAYDDLLNENKFLVGRVKTLEAGLGGQKTQNINATLLESQIELINTLGLLTKLLKESKEDSK